MHSKKQQTGFIANSRDLLQSDDIAKQTGFIEMILVIAGFFLLIGVGVYWFVSQSQLAKKVSAPNFAQQLEEQMAEPSSVPVSNSILSAELEAIQLEDPSFDLNSIDEDLSSL